MSAAITAEEIKETRGKYQLSQKAFADLLGIGSASIARYERGAEPSKANANLIRAAAHPEFMMECVERDGDLLTAAQREGVQRVYYACVSLPDADEAESDAAAASEMNAIYDLTLQQEVLNEQAANLMGEIISIKVSKGFSGKASDVFDSLLDQIARIKPTIVSSATMAEHKLAEVRGYLNCASELVGRRQIGGAE